MKLRKIQKTIFFAIVSMCMLASAFLFFSYKMNASTPLHVNDWKVDLAPLGEDWSNLCILGPYSTNETALSVTGLNLDIESRSDIATNDGIALLINLNDQGGYKLFEVPRRPSDFSNLSGECWPRGVEFFIAKEGHPFVLHP